MSGLGVLGYLKVGLCDYRTLFFGEKIELGLEKFIKKRDNFLFCVCYFLFL